MIATITKIDEPKESRSGKYSFRRVHFEAFDEEGNKEWYKTDLCDTFRNYANWKSLLKIGNTLSNLELKDKTTVDADSKPVLFEKCVFRSCNCGMKQSDEGWDEVHRNMYDTP